MSQEANWVKVKLTYKRLKCVKTANIWDRYKIVQPC